MAAGESGDSSESRGAPPGARLYDQSVQRRESPIWVLLQRDDRLPRFCDFAVLLLATHGVQPPPARDVATGFHPNPLVASFHSYSYSYS